MKKLSILSILFVALTLFSSTSTVFAKEWSMTLDPFCGVHWDNESYLYRDSNVTPKISLTRIVGGPSYYVRARAANGDGWGRSDYALCQQGSGFVNLSGTNLTQGYAYHVQAKNDYFETSYRWSYGEYEW